MVRRSSKTGRDAKISRSTGRRTSSFDSGWLMAHTDVEQHFLL
jgi:hypothetical protein